MQDVYKAIGRVAATDVNVLILGESGTGKELVTRAIHHHSRRSSAPLLAINCAAIPETLLESELFGHERGSFTGADRKVLRVLQDQRFERVGGNESVRTDARVIAATNQNLEQLAAAGRFRRDLYYRLKVYTIYLPALRDRLDDLPLLVDHFIKLYSTEVGKLVCSASAETIDALRRYDWPGNVRELQGAVKNALVNATDKVLTPDCLPANIRRDVEPTPPLPASGDRLDVTELIRRLLREGEADLYRKVLLAVDRAIMEETLSHVRDNQVEAARRLGISRTTLRAKLQSLKMTGRVSSAEPEPTDP
jgi:two-component system nitrogen regulation response regulator GlnG